MKGWACAQDFSCWHGAWLLVDAHRTSELLTEALRALCATAADDEQEANDA